MLSFLDFKTGKRPLYASLRLDRFYGDTLHDWCKQHGVENVDPPQDYHCTVTYSKTPIEDPSNEILCPYYADIIGWKVLGEGCLVLEIKSDRITELHNKIQAKYGASWDWPSYIPHITVAKTNVIPTEVPNIHILFPTFEVTDLDTDKTSKNESIFPGYLRTVLFEEYNEDYYDSLHKQLSMKYKYEPSEIEHIKKYTDGFGSIDLNGKLHYLANDDGTRGHNWKLTQEDHDLYNNMSKITKKYKTETPLTVYRGSFHGISGQENHGHGFMSTSIHPGEAQDFAGNDLNIPNDNKDHRHLWKIHIPAGSHGAYVAHHSEYENQKEFVLHPGAKLQFHKPPTKGKHGLIVWHARLVHDGIKRV